MKRDKPVNPFPLERLMYYFIINPHSRSGKGQAIWDSIKGYLDSQKTEYEAYFTEKPGHASDLAQQIAVLSIPSTLTVVGGDGTLNEVINGLARTSYAHITLGYLPTGSGNDFARGLELETEPLEALKHILSPQSLVHMDVGIASTEKEKRYFLISSGVGFDASICHEALDSPLKIFLNRLHLGKLTYVCIALKQLLLYPPCPISVRLDGHTIRRYPRAFFVAGMNLRYEGGGCKFCPDANCTDGDIHICVAGNLSKLKILFLFPTAFFGKHTGIRGIHIERGHRIDILCKRPLPVHCDGESFGHHNRLTLTTAPQQISVIRQ